LRPANALLGRIREVNAAGRTALCGYFLAGYPDPDTFYRAVRTAGALDVIEYGVPADDPSMDGATIAEAHRVVTRQRGIHVEPALALIGGINAPQPSFVMTYTRVGRELQGFLRLCAKNDLSGVLVPDIDPEEAHFVTAGARLLGLAVISLVDARASREALTQVAIGSDMVYLKVATGPTGEQLDLALQRQRVEAALKGLRSVRPDLLVAAGVGVQTPDHVAALAELGVDMVIVGTKVVEHTAGGVEGLSAYRASLRSATGGLG
jgi:tryptophan synthase alpha chain